MKITEKNYSREIFVEDEKGNRLKGIILFTFEVGGDDFISYVVEDELFFKKMNNENKLIDLVPDEEKLMYEMWEEYSTSDEFKDLIEELGFDGIENFDENKVSNELDNEVIQDTNYLDKEIKKSYKNIDSNINKNKKKVN